MAPTQMHEIIDCEEFDEISVRVSALLDGGELILDERIKSKGYLIATLKGGEICLRATRFVGIIPLTPKLAIRVKPRATIANLSYMLVRSGIIPAAVSGFSRGYMPRFISTEQAPKIYGRSLIDGVKLIARRGIMKAYVKPSHPTPWRGRLLTSETVRRHAAKGIRYRHEFEQNFLSSDIVENIGIKTALLQVLRWYKSNDRKNSIINELGSMLTAFSNVPTWRGNPADLTFRLSQKIRSLTRNYDYYKDSLWSSFLIIQNSLPELNFDGLVKLDSLIIDVSSVFESFVRRELKDRLRMLGYSVEDGNKRPDFFFRDSRTFTVHPDIIIRRGGSIVGILDAKYKPNPKEQDRYEVVAFMDAFNATTGGFICPANGVENSRYLGSTATGKKMFSLRYDLGAADLSKESDRLSENVIKMLAEDHSFT